MKNISFFCAPFDPFLKADGIKTIDAIHAITMRICDQLRRFKGVIK